MDTCQYKSAHITGDVRQGGGTKVWDHCDFVNNLENGETRLSSLLSGRGGKFDDVMTKTRSS